MIRAAVMAALTGRATTAPAPAPAPTPGPAPTPSGARTLQLGGNIELGRDYTDSYWIDATTQGRGFWRRGVSANDYTEDTNPTTLPRDANGMPTVPCNYLMWAYKGTLTRRMAGVWKLKATCSGTMSSSSPNVSNIQKAGNIITADITQPTETYEPTTPTEFAFSAGVSSLEIIAPGHAAGSVGLLPWTVDYLKSYECIRFMDATGTNAAVDTTWASRRKAGAAQIGGHLSWEAVATAATQLYNASGSKLQGIWVCIPHTSDLDYTTQLATFLRDNTPIGLKIYFEWSNELWNFGFTQALWSLSQAQAEAAVAGSSINWDNLDPQSESDKYTLWARHQGREFAKRAKLIHTAFGGVKFARARPVFMSQTTVADSQYSLLGRSLIAMDRIEGAPSGYCYAIGCAPYPQNMAMETAATVAELDNILTTFPGGLNDYATNMLPTYRTATANWGLVGKPMLYEFGPHTHPASGEANNHSNVVVKRDWHRSAYAKSLVAGLISSAETNGFELGCYFVVDCSGYAASVANDCHTLWSVAEQYPDAGTVGPKLQALRENLVRPLA